MISSVHQGVRPARLFGALVGLALPLCVSASALANPRPLPFSYPWETLTKGAIELEQYVDVAPLYVWDADHHSVLEPAFKITSEIEYGITDRLELGLYLVAKNEPDSEGAGAPLIFDGIKQRLRYRIAKENELPLDIALYFEVAELHDEIELEQKIILQKRFGALKAIANLSVEQAFERGGEVAFVLNPSGGLVYEVNQYLTLGAEYWMHAEYTLVEPEGEEEEEDPTGEWNHKPHHFVGPAVSFRWDRLWWTTGVYGRLDDFDRVIRPGDQFGRAWVRTVVGLGF